MNKRGTPSNLIPFKPGQSGNPSGLPKGSSSIAAALRRIMAGQCSAEFADRVLGKKLSAKITEAGATGAEVAAMVLATMGLKGNLEALRLMLSYCDGDPKQSLTLDGEVNTTITVETLREAMKRVS